MLRKFHPNPSPQARHSLKDKVGNLGAACFAMALLQSPSAVAQQAPKEASGYQLQMIGSRFTPNQAQRPDLANLEVPASQTIYLDHQAQFEIRTNTLYPGGIRFDFHIKGNQQGMATVDTLFWRNGNEIDRASAQVAAQTYADQVFLIPELLWSQARQIRPLQTPTELSESYQFKTFEDILGRAVSVTLRRHDQAILAARVGTSLYQYQPVSPTEWEVSVSNNGALNARWKVDSQAVAAREVKLEFPSIYQEKLSRGEWRIEPIADGVLRINGAPSQYHSHFVVGEHSIAAFDAPVSIAETAKAKSLLEQEVKGKTISHVVLSHTHRDHISGLPSYVSNSTQVMVGTSGTVALDRQLPSARPSIVEVSGYRQIDLGNRPIHLYTVPSSHAMEMLVAFDERSGILFQGDLFTLAEHGPVASAFEVNQELLDFIEQHNLKVNAIVGVHGRITNMSELRQSLQLRNTAK